MATTIAKPTQKSCIRNGQLELVTLRLPAPKVGFWARLFGGGRKKEEWGRPSNFFFDSNNHRSTL